MKRRGVLDVFSGSATTGRETLTFARVIAIHERLKAIPRSDQRAAEDLDRFIDGMRRAAEK